MTSKFFLISLTWGLAFLVSIGLKMWGHNHPQSFEIRSWLVWTLLFGPSLLLGFWLFINGLNNTSKINL